MPESTDQRPQRRSLRLHTYDYSQGGAYFITICTRERLPLFSMIHDSEITLTAIGQVVFDIWLAIPTHSPNAELDDCIAMPDHVHGIFLLPAGQPLAPIVGSFKSNAARLINKHRNSPVAPLWQRNYFEHVIRDEGDLNTIRRYVVENPARWFLNRS